MAYLIYMKNTKTKVKQIIIFLLIFLIQGISLAKGNNLLAPDSINNIKDINDIIRLFEEPIAAENALVFSIISIEDPGQVDSAKRFIEFKEVKIKRLSKLSREEALKTAIALHKMEINVGHKLFIYKIIGDLMNKYRGHRTFDDIDAFIIVDANPEDGWHIYALQAFNETDTHRELGFWLGNINGNHGTYQAKLAEYQILAFAIRDTLDHGRFVKIRMEPTEFAKDNGRGLIRGINERKRLIRFISKLRTHLLTKLYIAAKNGNQHAKDIIGRLKRNYFTGIEEPSDKQSTTSV